MESTNNFNNQNNIFQIISENIQMFIDNINPIIDIIIIIDERQNNLTNLRNGIHLINQTNHQGIFFHIPELTRENANNHIRNIYDCLRIATIFFLASKKFKSSYYKYIENVKDSLISQENNYQWKQRFFCNICFENVGIPCLMIRTPIKNKNNYDSNKTNNQIFDEIFCRSIVCLDCCSKHLSKNMVDIYRHKCIGYLPFVEINEFNIKTVIEEFDRYNYDDMHLIDLFELVKSIMIDPLLKEIQQRNIKIFQKIINGNIYNELLYFNRNKYQKREVFITN